MLIFIAVAPSLYLGSETVDACGPVSCAMPAVAVPHFLALASELPDRLFPVPI